MTTLGEKALELVRESVRANDMLGPFNEEKVRAVLEEMKSLNEEVGSNNVTLNFPLLFFIILEHNRGQQRKP